MHLEKLEHRPADWDELIKAFDSKTLFHESAWHDHILSIHKKSRMLYFSIIEKDKRVGYFCGLTVRKLSFNIMGSPLSGTGTNYMGPLVNIDVDQQKLIDSIDEMCKQEKIAYIELCNDILCRDFMENNGYLVSNGVTHKVEIAENIDAAFSNLKSTCRNRIRKGEKNNLQVEVSKDSSIVNFFFDQYTEVYGKQGKTTPFGIKRVKSLYDCLHAANRLLSIQVKKKDCVIATGLFPFDENAIYFWGAASWLKYQKFYPNELLHWEVIKFAVTNRIKIYNMCGGGSRFKNKFCGDDLAHLKYQKSTSRFIGMLISVYKEGHFIKLNFTPKHFKKKKIRIG